MSASLAQHAHTPGLLALVLDGDALSHWLVLAQGGVAGSVDALEGHVAVACTGKAEGGRVHMRERKGEGGRERRDTRIETKRGMSQKGYT